MLLSKKHTQYVKCNLNNTKLFMAAKKNHHQFDRNPPINHCSSAFSVILLYLLSNLYKLSQQLKSLRHTVMFSLVLIQIWIQKQPTGVGLAVEQRDTFTRRML